MGGGTEWVSANVLDGLVANFARNLDLCPYLSHILPHTAERPVPLFSKKHVFGFLVDSATVATLDPAEHTAQLWLPWQEAMAKTFSPTNRDAIWQLQRRAAKYS